MAEQVIETQPTRMQDIYINRAVNVVKGVGLGIFLGIMATNTPNAQAQGNIVPTPVPTPTPRIVEEAGSMQNTKRVLLGVMENLDKNLDILDSVDDIAFTHDVTRAFMAEHPESTILLTVYFEVDQGEYPLEIDITLPPGAEFNIEDIDRPADSAGNPLDLKGIDIHSVSQSSEPASPQEAIRNQLDFGKFDIDSEMEITEDARLLYVRHRYGDSVTEATLEYTIFDPQGKKGHMGHFLSDTGTRFFPVFNGVGLPMQTLHDVVKEG